jgi:hypothetical protein
MRHFHKTVVLPCLFICSISALNACQTVPYAQRLASFEADMNNRFVGKSADLVVLAFGPPHSSYTLTDGREVAQYREERSNTFGGDTYTSYNTVSRSREIINPDGTRRVVTELQQMPITSMTPIQTRHELCTRRFVISKEKVVEAFAWEGNSCFR